MFHATLTLIIFSKCVSLLAPQKPWNLFEHSRCGSVYPAYTDKAERYY